MLYIAQTVILSDGLMKEGLTMDAKNKNDDAVQEPYRYSVFIAFLLIISVKMSALNYYFS